MLASSLFALALAAVGVNAIQVTYPGKRDTWSTSGSQTIEWDSVSTDPSNFAIVLVNQDSSYLSKTTTLSDKVSTSDGKITVSFPSGNFPAGQSFQVNFVRVDQDNTILAQSQMFDIVQSAAATTAAQTTAAQTTTAATTTTAAATTTANSLPQTLSKAVASAASSGASAAASGASESGGVSIPAGNSATGGALSSFSSSAVLVAVAGALGVAALL